MKLQSLFENRDNPNFQQWFGDSVVVDNTGNPLKVYHGTGNMAGIDSFDPKYTGKGADQLGSGFYFTTNASVASGYVGRRSVHEPKQGGEDSPGVLPVYLSIQNPIVLQFDDATIDIVELTTSQAYKIMLKSPGLRDLDNSRLGDWYDIWSEGISDAQIRNVARHYKNIMHLENEFFDDHSDLFRRTLHAVTGYDGVVQNFEGDTHYVAWFPEQIKSVFNSGGYDRNDHGIMR